MHGCGTWHSHWGHHHAHARPHTKPLCTPSAAQRPQFGGNFLEHSWKFPGKHRHCLFWRPPALAPLPTPPWPCKARPWLALAPFSILGTRCLAISGKFPGTPLQMLPGQIAPSMGARQPKSKRAPPSPHGQCSCSPCCPILIVWHAAGPCPGGFREVSRNPPQCFQAGLHHQWGKAAQI